MMPPAVNLMDESEWDEQSMATNEIVTQPGDCQLEALILRVGDHPEVRLKLLAEVSAALEDCSELLAADRAASCREGRALAVPVAQP